MKILSIDASTKSSGWSVFEDGKLIDYGCITSSSTDMIKRIQIMIKGLSQVITNHNITTIVLEEVRPENGLQNIKTHRALMYLQAAIAFLVHENSPSTDIEFIYPSEWRKICGIKTGSGVKRDTLKVADVKFVKDNYGIDVNDDIADAIGIGHAWVRRNQPEPSAW
jgi:Holliday junction resolvasome RuvABC endonuclease subunit